MKLFEINSKDKLPTLNNSNIVYKFLCLCNKTRTSNNLLTRVNQHLPNSLFNKIRMGNDNREKGKTKDKLYSNSAIGEHLIENQSCFVNYNVNRF